MAELEFSDGEKWLTKYLRGRIDDEAITVTNREPDSKKLPSGLYVVVRYDGGEKLSLVTEASSFGVTVTGTANDTSGEDAGNLARDVYRYITHCPEAPRPNPFAVCTYSTGPVRVVWDTPRPRRYMTFTLTQVGYPVGN